MESLAGRVGEGLVDRQAAALDRLIRAYGITPPCDVLDCAAGIGTQAIGLTAKGYTVHATDISRWALDQAQSGHRSPAIN